jgi:hypothetical protein
MQAAKQCFHLLYRSTGVVIPWHVHLNQSWLQHHKVGCVPCARLSTALTEGTQLTQWCCNHSLWPTSSLQAATILCAAPPPPPAHLPPAPWPHLLVSRSAMMFSWWGPRPVLGAAALLPSQARAAWGSVSSTTSSTTLLYQGREPNLREREKEAGVAMVNN